MGAPQGLLKLTPQNWLFAWEDLSLKHVPTAEALMAEQGTPAIPRTAPPGCPLWWGKSLCNRYRILAVFFWNGLDYFSVFKMWWDVPQCRAWTLVEISPCLWKPQPLPVRGLLQHMERRSIVPVVTAGALTPLLYPHLLIVSHVKPCCFFLLRAVFFHLRANR